MKRIYRTVSALLTAALLMTMLLTGCGETSSSSIKGDAENYVKAVLDLMCTGTYDHSVTFGDVASGREQESRDEMIAGIVSSIAKDNDLNEEQRARLEDCLTRAFSACAAIASAVRSSGVTFSTNVASGRAALSASSFARTSDCRFPATTR